MCVSKLPVLGCRYAVDDTRAVAEQLLLRSPVTVYSDLDIELGNMVVKVNQHAKCLHQKLFSRKNNTHGLIRTGNEPLVFDERCSLFSLYTVGLTIHILIQ